MSHDLSLNAAIAIMPRREYPARRGDVLRPNGRHNLASPVASVRLVDAGSLCSIPSGERTYVQHH